MTNRKDIIKCIRLAAKNKGIDFTLLRQGGNHEVWDLDGVRIPIPRHSDIPEITAKDIYRECESKLGKGWNR